MVLKKTWYKNHYLISFSDGMLVFYPDGDYYNSYKLKLKVEYFWGLFEKQITIPFKVNMFQSIEAYESHWREIIDNGGKL